MLKIIIYIFSAAMIGFAVGVLCATAKKEPPKDKVWDEYDEELGGFVFHLYGPESFIIIAKEKSIVWRFDFKGRACGTEVPCKDGFSEIDSMIPQLINDALWNYSFLLLEDAKERSGYNDRC